MAEKVDPAVQAIWDVLYSDPESAKSQAQKAESTAKDPAIKAQIKEAMVEVYLQQGDYAEAQSAAAAMLAIAPDAALKAKAMLCSAQVLNVQGQMQDAIAKADEALAACKDADSQALVLRGKMSIYLNNYKYEEAKETARKALDIAQAAGDAKGEGKAQLMVAEAALGSQSYKEASDAAMAARSVFKMAGDLAGQGVALTMLVQAEMEDVNGAAVQAAQERLALFKGDAAEEAQSNLLMASAYVQRIAKKLFTCSLASLEDTFGALKAAKDAYDGYAGSADSWQGQDSCMREVSRTLSFNNVPGELIESIRDPTEALSQVTAGVFSNPRNALPGKAMVSSKNAKIEDIVPSAKQLDKGKFSWTRPLDGYFYTLIWQPAKDRESKRKPRGSYEVMTTCTGSTNMVTNADFLVKAHDSAERGKPMVVFMYSPDCYWNYTASFMALMNTFAALATSNVKFITSVHMNESHQDMATANDIRMRCCGLYNCTTGIVRTARIELPTIESGFVSGDVASWINDPSQLIENIFDTVEGDEGEFMYKRGEAFAPLLVHRPPEEEIQYVKPKRSVGGLPTR